MHVRAEQVRHLSSDHERYNKHVCGEYLGPCSPCLCERYTADAQKKQYLQVCVTVIRMVLGVVK